MKQSSLILFSVSLLLLCAALSNVIRPVRQLTLSRKSKSRVDTSAGRGRDGPVFSGNLKLGRLITNVASRFDSGSCRNANYQCIDNARPNFLMWRPENAPAIGVTCLPACFDAADSCPRVSCVRKNS